VAKIVENDLTKNIARPAVIIANLRTGGTFLSHCLSNHPDIFCDRAESLHHSSVWNRNLTVKQGRLLHCLLHQHGYDVSMTKLTYAQATSNWDYLIKTQPMVLWLRRENVIRQAVSVILNRMAREKHKIEYPQHSFDKVAPISAEIAPEGILKYARGLRRNDNDMRDRLTAFGNVLPLTYAGIIGWEGRDALVLEFNSGKIICEFLGVKLVVLPSKLRPINPRPLSETLQNWDKVREAITKSEFAELLKDET
jgi:hypothetical protein